MVIAESPQLDPGEVIAVLLVLLTAFLAGATVVGSIGTWLGRRLARRAAPAPAGAPARRRRQLALLVGGAGAAVVSWIALLAVLPVVYRLGALGFLVAGVPLPLAWGWWTERRGLWVQAPSADPPPHRPPPGPPSASPP